MINILAQVQSSICINISWSVFSPSPGRSVIVFYYNWFTISVFTLKFKVSELLSMWMLSHFQHNVFPHLLCHSSFSFLQWELPVLKLCICNVILQPISWTGHISVTPITPDLSLSSRCPCSSNLVCCFPPCLIMPSSTQSIHLLSSKQKLICLIQAFFIPV